MALQKMIHLMEQHFASVRREGNASHSATYTCAYACFLLANINLEKQDKKKGKDRKEMPANVTAGRNPIMGKRVQTSRVPSLPRQWMAVDGSSPSEPAQLPSCAGCLSLM